MTRNIRSRFFLSSAFGTATAVVLVVGTSAALAQEANTPPASAAMTTPAMAGPISANQNPYSMDLGGELLGKVYIGGAVTGMTYFQSSPTRSTPGDVPSYMDLTNAQITLQKTDGWFQYYIEAGNYSFPTLGSSYLKSSQATPSSYGVVPAAYVKLQGSGDFAAWSVEGGKLPALTGSEYNFTFQNMNIERGVLWNIEPGFSRGIQVNYADGPINASLSWNDGYYSNVLNKLSGFVSYVFGPSDTLAVSAVGDLGGPHFSLLDSGNLVDVIWTHTMGNLTISPYVQYSSTPRVGTIRATQEWGGAILASYAFNENFKLAGRFEYETSSGSNTTNSPNIISFGPGSDVKTFTITPTYQWKVWFIRAEASHVSLGSSAIGSGFGKSLTNADQDRLVLETGVVF